jgi:hypothetical protein
VKGKYSKPFEYRRRAGIVETFFPIQPAPREYTDELGEKLNEITGRKTFLKEPSPGGVNTSRNLNWEFAERVQESDPSKRTHRRTVS